MTSDGSPDDHVDPKDPSPASAGEQPPLGDGVDAEILDADVVEHGPTGSGSAGMPSVSGTAHVDPDYNEQGVPSFDFVRDKIEKRISTAIGSHELADASPEGRSIDEMVRKREEAAKKKLDEIRKSMGS